ncbi:MAG: MBL fold metallo-hydrolase [Brevinema sp.]
MIICYQNGVFNQNTWIYKNPKTKEAIVIDPGDKLNKLFDLLADYTITHILITHGHPDHIQGLAGTKNIYPQAQIVSHELSKKTFSNPDYNLSHYMNFEVIAPQADQTFSGEYSTISFLGTEWELFYTPGHAIDHICIYNADKKIIFIGDMILEKQDILATQISSGELMIPRDFEFTIGRTDYPFGCNTDMMYNSVLKILSLPEDTFVYSGHGRIFTIKEAKDCLYSYISEKIT